jgi:hypothetical protein
MTAWIAAWQVAEPLDAAVLGGFGVLIVILLLMAGLDVIWRMGDDE